MVTGKYNDAGTLKFTAASIPVVFSAACSPVSGSTATMTATYTLSPGIFDQG
jgi:hypothetical protein